MPKILSEQKLRKVKYISMEDYMSSMDSLENLEDKMAFTTRYLLAYGAEQNRDVPFEQAVHIAKMKIADASLTLRKKKNIVIPNESVDPNLSDEEDAPYRQFMLEPVQYLQSETTRLIQIEAGGNDHSPEGQKRINDLVAMSGVLSNDFDGVMSQRIDAWEVNATGRDFRARLRANYRGKAGLDKAFENTKPGLFAGMFGKYSTAYANLRQVYEAFNNPKHVLHDDLDALDKAATEYLRHVFPNWDPEDGLPSQADINRLSGTRKERAAFSYNLLKTSQQQRKGEQVYETIMNGNRERRAEREAGIEGYDEQHPPVGNEQFQNQIAQDLVQEYDENGQPIDTFDKEYAANFKDDSVEEEAEPEPQID